MSSASRNRAASLQSGRESNRGRQGEMKDFAMAPTAMLPRYFEPCAATAAMFLYAQGPSVVCCHHDTLAIERRFSRHSDEVQLLAVDNQSDVGSGRLVVSYDAGQNAIVWDLMTGDEVARFASYEHLTAAAWMKNGNVSFGNTQGNVILFEPQTSEHLSARTIDQIAITALAPSGDCRTFAIGYQNGQCLVATLQPRFTILHNLITSRGPSPIVTLHWHASSARQKSDMLASQTQDGDLRVWSVAKAYNSNDPAKVVRILKRTEDYRIGPNWMSWSKNGRIIQYSDSETLSWDVRTKHVTHDSIPTLEHVRGLAVYGPGATLFTLGANNTVQQFDLNTPAIMVANVQHPANLLPPSPPVSIEEQADKATTIASESEITFNPSDVGISESDDDHMSPYQRIAETQHQDRYPDERYDSGSVASSRSGLSGYSRESGGSRTPHRYPASLRSKGMTDNTYISAGSSLRSAARPYQPSDMYSQSSLSTTSTRSRRRPSRLRHEVTREVAEETKVNDLFKFTRSRLSDIPYKPTILQEMSRLTNDDLRRQMLQTIFGWNKEIEDLIRDEMTRHPNGASSRIMLAKWLGLVDQDIMTTTSSESMTSSDWMLLALSGIGGQASQHKIGRAYVQTLLEKGDIHAAATILIGMGDHNDAIEIYQAHKRYMEALIVTCLFFPAVWERQCAIVKKWGEWAIQHGQRELAIRCFACSGKESTEPWASPSAAQLTFGNAAQGPSINEVLSPPLSPPGLNRGPQRQVGKNSALKLITSFDNSAGKAKFFSQGFDDGKTPIAGGATPIAESAVDRSRYEMDDDDPATAVVRPSNRSTFNTPTSQRSFASSAFGNVNPLPSIGETHGETSVEQPRQKSGHSRRTSFDSDAMSTGMSVQRAATASPMMMKDKHRRIGPAPEMPPLPSPDPIVAVKMEHINRRNGSRDRMPSGLQLQLSSIDVPQEPDPPSPDASVTSSARYHWPSRRRGPSSVSSVTSASTNRSVRTTATGGRHLDNYIHSLDAASKKKAPTNSRQASRERERDRDISVVRDRRPGSRDRRTTREQSEDRGRPQQRTYPAKRSPTSPVPMSPEDLVNLKTPNKQQQLQQQQYEDASNIRPGNKSRASSRGGSHSRKPPPIDTHTRSHSAMRSPQSPQPMSAAPLLVDSEDEEDYARAVEAQEKFRQRHSTSRSSSRAHGVPPTPGSVAGSVRTDRDRSRSRHRRDRATPESNTRPLYKGRSESAEHAGDLKAMKEDRQRKRELAARELEARRKDLARSSASNNAGSMMHDGSHAPFRLAVETNSSAASDLPPRSKTAEPTKNLYGRGPTGAAHIGLPATPKAMRLVLDSDHKGSAPSVPPLPPSYQIHKSSNSGSGEELKSSPKKDEGDGDAALTLLPSTVYQPPQAPIPRCMSAPIPDEPSNRARHGGNNNTSQFSGVSRNQSVRSKNGRELGGIREGRATAPPRRGSHDSQAQVPPPPPPAPSHQGQQGSGMLKELQHLAQPPPPPPAPLPHVAHQQSGSALASGMIEIVMDEDEEARGQSHISYASNTNTTSAMPPPPPPAPQQPITVPSTDITVPILPPPAPPSMKGHSRGRSTTDTSIAGRISKATERLRSASRSRKDNGLRVQKSPEIAPYESIQPPPMPYQPGMRSPPLNTHNLPTGLHESELI